MDDEPLARENLVIFARGQDDIEIGEQCERGRRIGAVLLLSRPDVAAVSGYSDAAYQWTGDGRNAFDPEHRPYIVFNRV